MCLEEAIASGIVQPRVVVGASDARVQMDSFSGQLLRCKLAHVGGQTGKLFWGSTLLFPGLESFGKIDSLRILNPLDDLRHGDKVNIFVRLEHLIHPIKEGIEERRVVLQPSGVEEQTKRGSI